MEQFVFVPAFVYIKSLTSQTVTKQELPKYQTEQNLTYQINSLKKDINKKLFAEAYCCFLMSSYQALKFA